MQRRHTSAEIERMRAIAGTMPGAGTEDWVRAFIVEGMSVAEAEKCAETLCKPGVAALMARLGKALGTEREQRT